MFGAERVVAFELRVRAPRDKFLCSLFDARLRGTADSTALDARADASIEIADRAPAMLGESLRRILLVRADEAQDAARALADRGQLAAAAVTIRSVMSDIEAIPGWIASDGSPLASSSVSRRHAEIFASAGEFWIADLGSTNPTIVNGGRLASAPHKLLPGDIVTIGEIAMRYEQG